MNEETKQTQPTPPEPPITESEPDNVPSIPNNVDRTIPNTEIKSSPPSPNISSDTNTVIPNNVISTPSPNLVPEPETPKTEIKNHEQPQPPPPPPRQMPTIPQQADLATSTQPNTAEQFKEIYTQSPRKAIKFFENNAEKIGQELAKILL